MENSLLKYSRAVIFVHEDVGVEIRYDLMNDKVNSIWLSLGLKNQKKITLGGLYREWQQLGGGVNSNSGTQHEQLKRWKMFLSQWKDALSEDKETVVLGDLNIDWFTCFNSDPSLDSKTYQVRPLVEQLTTQILPLGVCLLVDKVTRTWPGHRDSCLDLIFTNRSENMSQANFCVSIIL